MWSTWLGMAVGVTLAPTVALVTLLRRGRVFHPGGATWRGTAVPAATGGAALRCAERLSGPCRVRFSGGLWGAMRDDVRDILGCTVHLERDGRHQHLLFASFRHVWRAVADTRTSDTRNVLRNTYYTASWSRDDDLGVVTFRLVPDPRDGGDGPDAAARLDAVVAAGGVRLRLEASADGAAFEPVLDLHLEARADPPDDDRTSFSPFVAGRGVVPVGFVNGVRRVVYVVGRAARRAEEPRGR